MTDPDCSSGTSSRQEMKAQIARWAVAKRRANRLYPLLALACLVLIAFWQLIGGDAQSFTINKGSIASGSVYMQITRPYYRGRDHEGQIMEITADKALQIREKTPLMTFTNPKAQLYVKSSHITISARTATLNRLENKMIIPDARVEYRITDGSAEQKFDVGKTILTLKDRRLQSNATLRGQGAFGQMEAKGFHWDMKSRNLTLTGVKLSIDRRRL